jgi:hypothetical protein
MLVAEGHFPLRTTMAGRQGAGGARLAGNPLSTQLPAPPSTSLRSPRARESEIAFSANPPTRYRQKLLDVCRKATCCIKQALSRLRLIEGK